MPHAGHVYYEEFGDGQPLVLLHGHTLDRRMWRQVVPLLADRYRVITPDLAEHGRSGATPAGQSPADDLAGLLHAVGIARAAVCGLSMGGGTAVGFALDYPQLCAALVPVDSALAGFRFPTWPGPRPYVKMARAEGLAPALEAWLADALFASVMATPAAGEVRAIVHDFPGGLWLESGRVTAGGPAPGPQRPDAERLGEVTAPTLVVVGEHDLPDFQQIADLLMSGIPGARRAVIPGAGHLAPIEQPRAFAEVLLAFLEQVAWE
ncbi:MAG: bioH [Firmicutes bacterium]|nr:bioH [Bacillota bacterium]